LARSQLLFRVLRIAAATGAVGLFSWVQGCGPVVERAPFSVRADSLERGDLLGPYDGVVTDADTERPVSGALVAASWAFERGLGLGGPAGTREVVVKTTADGRYRIPALEDLPAGGSARVRRFTLIVYLRGYVGWRSDRIFGSSRRRRDFSQRGNRVRLTRWREGDLHHQHVVFLGGGAVLKEAMSWELQASALELDGKRPMVVGAPTEETARPPSPSLLDATELLSEDEVRGVTGYAGEIEIGRLSDLPRTEFYDSRHFKARGRSESYDVALRLWRLGPAAAEAQYRKLLSELEGARAMDEVGHASLRARAGDILGLAFVDRERGLVVSVSCGRSQCPEEAMVLRLAKLVEGHLGVVPVLPTLPAPAGQGGPPSAADSKSTVPGTGSAP
jgi:hypothetical protein